MLGGGVVTLSSAGAGYSSEITFTVVMSCLMAASGGLIFGYDISITGQCYLLPFGLVRSAGSSYIHEL